ncbi:sodium:solute symporter [Opitutaceae bacterium EW11]|nr:sodium:solute symporter [Opitutaceae bacterium EW11]
MLPRFARFLALLLATVLAATASPLISLQQEPASAQEFASAAGPEPATLPPLDGPAAALQALAHVGQDGAVWLLASSADGRLHWLRHAPDTGWTVCAPPPPAIAAGPLNTSSQTHVLAFGREKDGAIAVFGYHTITNRWARLGGMNLAGTVTNVRPGPAGFYLEVQDEGGAKTHRLLRLAMTKRPLSGLDYVVVGTYLAFVMGVGLFFAKERNRDEYFLGGRRVPWWAAGFSLYATGTSAISFMAIPAKSFATNWQYLCQNLIGLIGTIYVAVVIIPLIRRLNLTSVYGYLEMRFHPVVRTTGSFLIILFKLVARMGVVLYLPALAISAVTGLNEITSILLMGVVTTLYTTAGGMKAVIWTDIAQVVVMFGGAALCIYNVVRGIDGGVAGLLRIADADHKLKTFDWSFDFTTPSVWLFVLLVLADSITWPRDQIQVQRCLCTPNARDAGRSVWTLAVIILPGSFLFFSIGTALYAFYQMHPERLNPLLKTDSIVPHFIASELPPGVTGLVIAALFAASMSALNSCMHSIATLVSVDFYERFAKDPRPATSLKVAKWSICFTGLFGTFFALLLTRYSLPSIFDTFMALAGLLGGGFAGTYALGIFTRRTNWQGAMIGTVCSIFITLAVQRWTTIHFLLYTGVAVFSCIAIGYATSYLFPQQAKSLEGLTIYDRPKNPVSKIA